MFEPVDHVLKRIVILMVEEIAPGLDLDELSDELLLRNVGEDDILRILVPDRKLVWNPGCIFGLLGLQVLLEVIDSLRLQELRVLKHLSDGPVAWSDVSLDYFLEVLVGFVRDGQLGADVGSDGLLGFLDVDVDDVVLVELPCQRQMISALRRWSEVEFAVVFSFQLRKGYG